MSAGGHVVNGSVGELSAPLNFPLDDCCVPLALRGVGPCGLALETGCVSGKEVIVSSFTCWDSFRINVATLAVGSAANLSIIADGSENRTQDCSFHFKTTV